MSNSPNVVTSFLVLMRLAYDVGQAKKARDPERLRKAEENLAEYEALCKTADRMSLNRNITQYP